MVRHSQWDVSDSDVCHFLALTLTQEMGSSLLFPLSQGTAAVPTFLAPGTSFLENNFSTEEEGDAHAHFTTGFALL